MRYEMGAVMGRGGMGEVLRAYDPTLGRHVALKWLHRDDPRTVARMLREARAQAQVDHPNICTVYEVGDLDGRPYIAMQLIEGATLDQSAGRLSLEQKVALMQTVAEAVHAAHRVGLVHRDLKPGNILVEMDDDRAPMPFVVDFGIAHVKELPGNTLTGEMIGTPGYMSPEQARGDSSAIDRRSDVFSLGAVYYQLLGEQPPFEADSGVEVLIRLLHEDPVPLRQMVPNLPVDLETIVATCLEKDPSRRYPSARALAEDIARYRDGEPIAARPLGWLGRLRRKTRKHPGVTAVVIASSLALSLGAAKYTLDLQRERSAAVAARREAEALLDFMLTDLHESVRGIGRLDLLEQVARRASDHFAGEDGGQLAADDLLRRALSLKNIGTVLKAQGDLEAAGRAFEHYRSLLGAPERADPTVRLELAIAEQHVAEVLQEQGDLDAAREALMRSLEHARALQGPGAPEEGRRTLAEAHADLGWLEQEAGDFTVAADHFRQALRLLDPIAAGSVEARFQMSGAHSYLAFVLQMDGRMKSARHHLRRALEIVERLIADDPTNGRWQLELALVHNRFGYVHVDRGDPAAAIASFEKAAAVGERLVARDPANAKWQRELAYSVSGLAQLRRQQGDLAAARELVERSLAISERLAAQDPTNASAQNDLAVDRLTLGRLLSESGDSEGARALFEAGLALIAPIAERTGGAYYRNTFAAALLFLGRVDEARPVVEALVAEGWEDVELFELARDAGIEGVPPAP